MNASAIPLAGDFAGRYTVERELGRGATSIVYLAHDSNNDRPVAIKVLRRELAESLSANRFLREIRLTAQLQHPHIVPVLDSGEFEGRLYCVLPYMDGGTLRMRLERERQLPIDAALAIGVSVSRALELAHSRNIIHRDVKPENILFAHGEASLADFGIARAIEQAVGQESTSTGIVRGTPAYMSPEQATGVRDYDGRSDIYSVGCVVYEMIAGMPAFVGPTPQSLVAQRLSHLPQPLRVYRPQTPEIVQRIIARALATAPADRYQSAAEFASALADARTAIASGVEEVPSSSAVVRWARTRSSRPLLLLAAAAVVVVAAYAAGRSAGWLGPAVRVDTTRVVVFPFEGEGAVVRSMPQELFHTALRRWQGLTVVPLDETALAMRRRGLRAPPSPDTARAIAAALGAARFVLGRIARTPTGLALFATYRDVSAGTLHASQLDLPTDSARIAAVYAAIADSLVLRGATDGGPPALAAGPRHLFATQSFIRALAARDQWDLARSDSLFTAATELDRMSARASLWAAQVREWRGLPSDRWITFVERALADSTRLTSSERAIAIALGLLGHGEYARACAAYQPMVRADSRSFVGWYGLGECVRRDTLVVPDARSPSGWRYRSSYQQAINAYARAFEVLPATYQGFQAGGYGPLRSLLFTSSRALRRGISADSTHREFLARPSLSGDTIAFIPFERNRILAGDPRARVSPVAIARLRARFHEIAARWTGAFPRSAGAKEAIAVSLELQGDRAALDSIRATERLAIDPAQRLRFAAARVVLQLKFGIPDRLTELEAARDAADSLLRAHPAPSVEEATHLAPLTAIVGRCTVAAALMRRLAAGTSIAGIRIPSELFADASVLQAYAVLGCTMSDTLTWAADIAARISAAGATEQVRSTAEYVLLGGLASATLPNDSALVTRLAPNGDYLIEAAANVLAGHADRARLTLERVSRNRRNAVPGDFTPDAALPEARLWLRIGDTTAAVRVLESTLGTASEYPPLAEAPTNNLASIGSLIGAMALRAELAVADTARARRWSRAVVTLWTRADRDLQPQVRRMMQLAGR